MKGFAPEPFPASRGIWHTNQQGLPPLFGLERTFKGHLVSATLIWVVNPLPLRAPRELPPLQPQFYSPQIHPHPLQRPPAHPAPSPDPHQFWGFCLHHTKSSNQGRGTGGEGEEALFSFSNLILLKLHSKKKTFHLKSHASFMALQMAEWENARHRV